MKFVLQPDHIRVNNYRMDIVGLPPITFTAIGGIERETDKVDLPDRTQASGGRTKPGEVEVSVPAHHTQEVAAMDAWREEAHDPVSPTYKKSATTTMLSGTLLRQLPKNMVGAWLSKDGTPDLEMNDDGEMAVIKYTLCWDDVL